MKKEHILIIRFSALGDVAMTVPVVYSLARQYPHLRITVLSRSFARPFFDSLAPNVSFMEADLKYEYHGVKGLNTLYRRLAAKQFTAIADFHNVLRSDYLRMRFNLGRYRVEHIDKHRRQRRQLVSYNNKVRESLPSSFQNYADVLARLGYPVELEFTSIFAKGTEAVLPLTDEQKGDLGMLPAAIGRKRDSEQWIGLAPFAAYEGKVYPLHLMRQVVDGLVARHPQCRIFLFGRGQEEKRAFDDWCRDVPQCLNVSGQIEGLFLELVLMSHLDVMVSMDSANMHLASLVAVPVVSVWGATHPMAGFMGWNQKEANIVQADLDCRPCSIFGKKPCMRGDYACMNNIKPEQILGRIESILTKNQEET